METLVPTTRLTAEELHEAWPALAPPEQVEGFRLLDPTEADDFFQSLPSHGQAALLVELRPTEQRVWLRLLAPDDAADVLQELEPEERPELLSLLDEPTRRDVRALLAYAEDEAGGLMSPRFARLRPDMSVDEAISYLRLQARGRLETLYYVYVLDSEQRLLGVVSFRDLFAAPGARPVHEVMQREVVTVPEDMDQEQVARVFAEEDLTAIPVVDAEGRMKGIVTVDDIVDVVEEEATEDIHKLGGLEALDAPYLETGLGEMVKKRAGWLALLFCGELITASAMGRFADEISKAVVLALFVPLIISSGGNSGSQASTLVIRAMALGEVRLRDWYRIARRELASGLALGLILAAIGIGRIVIWEQAFGTYGEHYLLYALTIGTALLGVVLWGTLSGAMLPLLLKRLGLDPASASAPFVATLVDVFGLLFYFSVARAVLTGTVL
ncbi:MAG TPA: magnesium transporter [Thermoanaerobaculia bacterium]|nr:magnesium transporter [Thermoanaerobaculia bacterium]